MIMVGLNGRAAFRTPALLVGAASGRGSDVMGAAWLSNTSSSAESMVGDCTGLESEANDKSCLSCF